MDEVFELPLSEENNHVDDNTNDELEIDLVSNHSDNIDKVEDIVHENNVDEHLKQSGAVNNKKTKARLKVEKDHNTRLLQMILKEVKRPGKSEYTD